MGTFLEYEMFIYEDYLQQKFSLKTKEDNLWVNSSICPDINLVKAIKSLSIISV